MAVGAYCGISSHGVDGTMLPKPAAAGAGGRLAGNTSQRAAAAGSLTTDQHRQYLFLQELLTAAVPAASTSHTQLSDCSQPSPTLDFLLWLEVKQGEESLSSPIMSPPTHSPTSHAVLAHPELLPDQQQQQLHGSQHCISLHHPWEAALLQPSTEKIWTSQHMLGGGWGAGSGRQLRSQFLGKPGSITL